MLSLLGSPTFASSHSLEENIQFFMLVVELATCPSRCLSPSLGFGRAEACAAPTCPHNFLLYHVTLLLTPPSPVPPNTRHTWLFKSIKMNVKIVSSITLATFPVLSSHASDSAGYSVFPSRQKVS